MSRFVLPPKQLMRRVGWAEAAREPGDVFAERGTIQWEFLKTLLPEDWDFVNKRVLDFGCGVGRMLIPATVANPEAEFWGCDIHAKSIAWLQNSLSSRATVFRCGELPPLPQADNHFDLAYAFSVFTHLVDSWSAWLLELHRVLADDGILIATVYGPGQQAWGDEPVSEELIGMNVLKPSSSWDIGGPLIVHSQWWLREHWGRALDILDLQSGDPSGAPPMFGQAVVVMRKRPGNLTITDLERPGPDTEKELAALRQNIESLRREIAEFHEVILKSHSWRLTAPLRRIALTTRQAAAHVVANRRR